MLATTSEPIVLVLSVVLAARLKTDVLVAWAGGLNQHDMQVEEEKCCRQTLLLPGRQNCWLPEDVWGYTEKNVLRGSAWHSH